MQPYIIQIGLDLDGKNEIYLDLHRPSCCLRAASFKIPKLVLQIFSGTMPKCRIINRETKLNTHGLPFPVQDALIAQYSDWTIVVMQKGQVFENVIYEIDLREGKATN